MLLGEMIKEYRRKHDLSQRQFALMSGLSNGYISMLERNLNPSSGRPLVPSLPVLKKVASAMRLSLDDLMQMADDITVDVATQDFLPQTGGVWVPVLGKIAAGIPIEAIEDILDYEEIPASLAAQGEFFALKVSGNSMEPRILDGDVVIVKQQPDADSGEVVVVIVNGEAVTVKRIKKRPEGIMLIPNNHAYTPMFYSNKEIEELPVVIIGKVVEIRGKSL
jgi:repressor LexA